MGWYTLLATSMTLSTMIATAPVVRACTARRGEIRVVVRGLRNGAGRVGCSLFNDAQGFPRNREKEYCRSRLTLSIASWRCERKSARDDAETSRQSLIVLNT